MPSEYDPKPLPDETHGDSGRYELASPRHAPPPLPPPIHTAPPIVAGPLPAGNGKATTAMVLGIVSCAIFCFCWGVPSIVCGILAIVFAGQAERELAVGRRCRKCLYDMGGIAELVCPECGNTARDEHELLGVGRTGAGQARAGRICGIVGLSLAGLMMVFGIVMMVIAIVEEASKNP